jgi:ACT domain-containing protein
MYSTYHVLHPIILMIQYHHCTLHQRLRQKVFPFQSMEDQRKFQITGIAETLSPFLEILAHHQIGLILVMAIHGTINIVSF